MSPGDARPQWLRGPASRQAHADLPPGTVEEEHGREGFSGPASHLYRLHPPTAWTSIDGPLRPMALDARRLDPDAGAPVALVCNDELVVAWERRGPGAPDWFERDADGDRLYFVHRGSGRLTTEYGPLRYRPGHYLLVPRATTHRFECDEETDLLVVVALGSAIGVPDRGLLGRHAIFDPAILDVPEPEPVDETGAFEIRITRDGYVTAVTYPHHPYDVVGWKGDLAPMALHVDDIRPVAAARYHLPPSAHTTFTGNGFVVATFAPRPLESDPAVLRVPFYHRNVDYDEVIFYHRGDFFSRAGIEPGMLTFHPAGIHHGPQPQAVARSAEAGPGGFADEVAVNIDARRALVPTDAARAVSDARYVESWKS